MKNFLQFTFAISLASIALSWWIYLPIYLNLLKRRDAGEFARAGGRSFPSSGDAGTICMYLIRREYRTSTDRSIRRHGAILRWTLAFPTMLGAVALVGMMIYETLLRD